MPLSIPQLVSFVKENYALTGTLIQLPGEIDLNYLLTTDTGDKYVLKIAPSERTKDNLDLQNQIIEHLANQHLPINLPQLVLNLSKTAISTLYTTEGSVLLVRLYTWVEGRLLAKVNPHHPALLESLGRTCGYLCRGLANFDHEAAYRFFKWDIAQIDWIKNYWEVIETPEQLNLVQYFLYLYHREVTPLQDELRKGIIYNDANDYNILISGYGDKTKVTGVIDFGDAIHTYIINDLAIACAYAIMDKNDPLTAACAIVKGFHTVYPLTEAECAALFPLIAGRLAISVTVSAINKQKFPDEAYLQISATLAWDTLKKLQKIAPDFAHYTFRATCGYDAHPDSQRFKQFAINNQTHFASLVKTNLTEVPIKILDLSVGSLELGNNPNFEDATLFDQLVDDILAKSGVQIGIGRYNETRPLYTTDSYLVQGNEGPIWRTVHIGLDVFMKAETPIYAPLAGKIHSLQNNAGERDYGPTIIMEHLVDGDLKFYTLYGHLNEHSIKHLYVGQVIEKGQQIAGIGPRPINGNWPPHLHFQIMLDLLDYEGDFPGVVFPHQRHIWTSICPDPNLLIGIQDELLEAKRYDKQDIYNRRKRHLGHNLSLSYQSPLYIQRGFMQYLYNHEGRRFLDTVNNVAHVGHQHPKVIQAAQRQIAILNTNTRYLHHHLVEYATELCATLPEQLSVCYFVNSGSEANELALRLAQTYTNQQDMIAVEVGYHGNTNNCIDVSSYKFNSPGGNGKKDHIHIVPMPDTYRGLYRKTDNTAGKKYAQHLQQAIELIQAQGRSIAGFICESILSCGGQIVLPDAYLATAFDIVRQAGGVCIADEVQTGFGRIGKHFWAFELQEVVPDIVTMGKPIGNGHPLGAVVTTPDIAAAFDNGMEYFNTFGGNPVSCAIGRTVLKVIQEENLQKNALQVGHYLKQELGLLSKTYPIIGDVRGEGLFLGFELIKDPTELIPAAQQATYLANRMRQHGLLMSTDGPDHNVIKIKPPMVFSMENADFLLDVLDKVLQEDVMKY